MRRQVFNSLTDCFNLPNGVRIPCVGFGTYKTPDGAACVESVLTALGAGYRHIDTAEFYFNEESVGRAIAESGVPRDEIFVTTKVWNTHQGYDATLAAFDESAKKLGLDTVDLYLVHWPIAKDFKAEYPAPFLATWRALEKLYAEGRVRAIGVCNCLKSHLNVLFGECKVMPAVNQLEYHFGFTDADQLEAVAFSSKRGRRSAAAKRSATPPSGKSRKNTAKRKRRCWCVSASNTAFFPFRNPRPRRA